MKKIVILLTTVFLIGGLVACGNAEPEVTAEIEKYDINMFQEETGKNDKGEYDLVVPEYNKSETVFDNEHISIITNNMTRVEDSTFEYTGYTNIIFDCTVTNKTQEKLEISGFTGFVNDLYYDSINLGILKSNDDGFLSVDNMILAPSESKSCQILIRDNNDLRRDIAKVDKVDIKVNYHNENFTVSKDNYFTIFLCDETEYKPFSIDKENSILLYEEGNNKAYLENLYIYYDSYSSDLNYLGIDILLENDGEFELNNPYVDTFYFKVLDTTLNEIVDDIDYSTVGHSQKGKMKFCHYGIDLKDKNISNLEDVKELIFKMNIGETLTNEGIQLEKSIQFK